MMIYKNNPAVHARASCIIGFHKNINLNQYSSARVFSQRSAEKCIENQ